MLDPVQLYTSGNEEIELESEAQKVNQSGNQFRY